MCVGTGTAARARVRTSCCGDHVVRQAYQSYCGATPASRCFLFLARSLCPWLGRGRFFLGRAGAVGAGGDPGDGRGGRRGAGGAGRALRLGLRGILPPSSIVAAGHGAPGWTTRSGTGVDGRSGGGGGGGGGGSGFSGSRARDCLSRTNSQ